MILRKIRKEKEMTQKTLADTIGVGTTAISNYEKGIREPNIGTLKKLATVLECTVDELLRDDDDSEK
jgi:transcriptional regulator with XRE-family HTH domain